MCDFQDLEHVDEDSWSEEVDEADTPVFVFFYAPWCRPCRLDLPMLHELHSRLDGKAKLLVCDVVASPGLTIEDEFDIRSVPTYVFLKNGGKEFGRRSGVFHTEGASTEDTVNALIKEAAEHGFDLA